MWLNYQLIILKMDPGNTEDMKENGNKDNKKQNGSENAKENFTVSLKYQARYQYYNLAFKITRDTIIQYLDSQKTQFAKIKDLEAFLLNPELEKNISQEFKTNSRYQEKHKVFNYLEYVPRSKQKKVAKKKPKKPKVVNDTNKIVVPEVSNVVIQPSITTDLTTESVKEPNKPIPELPKDVFDDKKRGRKRKTEINKLYYDENYVAMWQEICNGEIILVDGMNNAFTFDMKNPKYLGKFTLDGKIDSTAKYNPPVRNFRVPKPDKNPEVTTQVKKKSAHKTSKPDKNIINKDNLINLSNISIIDGSSNITES